MMPEPAGAHSGGYSDSVSTGPGFRILWVLPLDSTDRQWLVRSAVCRFGRGYFPAMTPALWIGVCIALLAGIVGVPLALGMFRKRDR